MKQHLLHLYDKFAIAEGGERRRVSLARAAIDFGVVDVPARRVAAAASAAGEDGVVRLFDPISGKEELALKGHKGAVQGCAFSPDGKTAVSSAADWSVRVWETASGKQMYAHTGLLQGVGPLVVAPDGRHLAAAGQAPLVFVVRPGRFHNDPNYGTLLTSADSVIPPTPQYTMQWTVEVVEVQDASDPIHPKTQAISPPSAPLSDTFFRS